MVQPETNAQGSSTRSSTASAPAWWKPVGVIALGIAGGVALLAGLVLFARPLALLFLAICIAAALTPFVRRLSTRMRRNTAIMLLYVTMLVILVVLAIILVRPFFGQLNDFIARLPEVLEQTNQFLQEHEITTEQLQSISTEIGRYVIFVPGAALSAVFDAFLVLVVSLYLLLEAPKIRQFILSLFNEATRERIDALGMEMVQVTGGYVRGIAINVMLVSTVVTIGLIIIRMPFALVLGVTAGLFETLPVIGSVLGAVPTLLVALWQSPGTAIVTMVFVFIVQQVQGNIITPNVMKSQVSLPLFIIPLALMGGSIIGGVLGALISVPLAAVIRVFVLRVIVPTIRAQTGATVP